MKILIVDDEQDVEFLFRQRFRKELREGLLEFHFAHSGADALSYLTSLTPLDIMFILSDINMPGMTGLEMLKNVKEKFPHLKVCMITAYGDDQNYKTAMEYGAEKYLTKPIDFEKLRKEVLAV
ncbi:MAG TPA: response regulator [Bacteroidota bacterium]|jgi:YesN/AraC family two-component response regulator|nr:response regulator [Bacteroidota bacterium]